MSAFESAFRTSPTFSSHDELMWLSSLVRSWMSSSISRRSWFRRTCGTVVVSRESSTRSRCWRSPNTICVVRGVEPLVGVCTKSERLIATSLSKIEFVCQICQLIVLDVQAPRIEWRTGFHLPFQPPSGHVNFLFARQTASPALESRETAAGNTNHGFFSIHSKEEEFGPVP